MFDKETYLLMSKKLENTIERLTTEDEKFVQTLYSMKLACMHALELINARSGDPAYLLYNSPPLTEEEKELIELAYDFCFK